MHHQHKERQGCSEMRGGSRSTGRGDTMHTAASKRAADQEASAQPSRADNREFDKARRPRWRLHRRGLSGLLLISLLGLLPTFVLPVARATPRGRYA